MRHICAPQAIGASPKGHFLDMRGLSGRRSSAAGKAFVPRGSTGDIPLFRFVILAVVAALSLPAPALAQGAVRSEHGDWEMRCDTPPGAQNEQCVLMQYVTAEDRENVGLTVIVLKTADKQAQILRVLAPLGVLLPRGLGLRIDDQDLGSASFIRCLPNGCVAEVIMDGNLIGQLSAGEQATFIIFQTPEEGIGIPISLNGFAEGFDALP